MAQLNWNAFLKNRTYNYVTRTPEQFDAGRHIGEEPRGLLGSAWDNLWGGMESMVGSAMDTAGTVLKAQYAEGRASHPAGVFGKFLVDRAIDLNQSAAENARRSGIRNEYSDMGIFDRLTSPSYLLDPRGFTAEVSNMTGSMIPFMLMSAVMPEVGAGTAAGLIGGGLSRFGVKKAAELFKPGGAGAEFLRDFSRWAPTGVVDAAANAGEVGEEMRRQGRSDTEIANAMGEVMKYELPYDIASQGVFGAFLGGKGVRKFTQGGGVGRNIAANAAAGTLEAVNEGAQEFVQTQAVEHALGKPVGTFMNPTDEERKAFNSAVIGTLPMVVGAGARNVIKNWGDRSVEPRRSELQSSPMKSSGNENIDALIAQAAEKYGVPVNLLHSIAQTESEYNQDARSEVGAIGMMQLMPDTAAGLGVDPNDLAGNIEGGAKYMRELLDTFDGDLEKAVAAYNAGPNAVKKHGGIPPFAETQDYVRKVLGGLDDYDTSVPQRMRNLADDAAPYIGVTMDNGENGCVEAVTKIGAKSCPFLAQELENGVVNVDRLVEHAGDRVIPFDPNSLEEGDVIVYGDKSDPQRHVVLYDGKGGYIGNSTQQNKVVQGSDYNEMGSWSPTKIIKTGAQFGSRGMRSVVAPVIPDFTGLIADEKNIAVTQEAIQNLINTDRLTPAQHAAILQAAEMIRDMPVGDGTDAAAEAENVNEWQSLIDRKDVKGIFEKEPQKIVQMVAQRSKEQRRERTRAAIENQQKIEETKQAIAAVQTQANTQPVQAAPMQGDQSVQQIVPDQVEQMGIPDQPENVMRMPQEAPPISDAFAAGLQSGATDAVQTAQPEQPHTPVSQEELAGILSKVQQWEQPLLSVPEYVAARNRQDWAATAQIARAANVPGVAQFYDTLMEHGSRNATNITPYAPQQEAPHAPQQSAPPIAVPSAKAPVPVVGVRPNVPTRLPDNIEERRALGRSLGRFMTDNKINIPKQLGYDLAGGRGKAIQAANDKITAWEEKRAEQEADVNTSHAAQENAQGDQNTVDDRMLAQRGTEPQNSSHSVREKSAQNQADNADRHMDWIAAHPFKYDDSLSMEENIQRAEWLAREYLDRFGTTDQINSHERQELRKRLVADLYGNGAKRKEGKVFLVVGLPASGKSSAVVEPLAQANGALVIDSDMAKEKLPEFNSGLLAGAVHGESSAIADLVRDYAVTQNDNIVLPLVGKTEEKLRDTIRMFRAKGYEVSLHYVGLPVEKAVERAKNRFRETGRLVAPEYVRSVGLQPKTNYDKIKVEKEVDSYGEWDNDVAQGENARLLETRPEGLHASDWLGGRGEPSLHIDGVSGEREAQKAETRDNPPRKINRSDNQGGFSMQNSDEEFEESPLTGDEREAVKGLSADAKNVYQMVRNKLSGMKNKKVARAASAGAVLLARHADIIARKVRATLGTPFTAMDYYRTWFDLRYGDAEKPYGGFTQKQVETQKDAVRKQYEGTAQWMKAPNGDETNLTEDQWLAVRTPAFKAWFGDWETDSTASSKVLDDNGEPKIVYHGTKRKDRIGSVFRKERATSGPMAFFTDLYDIAENYSRNKQDTSIDNPPYEEQFRIKNLYGDMPLHVKWRALSPAKQQEITEKASHVTQDDDGNIVYDEDIDYGIGNYKHEIKEFRGNAIRALEEGWLNGGTLFGDEGRFLEVLKLAGVEGKEFEGMFFDNPNATDEGVFRVFMDMKKPFDTSKDITKGFMRSLRAAAKKAPKQEYEQGVDFWDKRAISPMEFVERVEHDLENGTTHAWTAIPDWVTVLLRKKGYNGIRDTGGKNGGAEHTVYIPFESNQIKSVDNNGAFSPDDVNIFNQSAWHGKPHDFDGIDKFNQQMNEIVKGTTQDVRDGQRIVSLFEEADESTFLHEMGHLFLLDLERLADMSPTSAQELQTVKKWAAWSEGQAEEYKDTPFAVEFAYLDARIRAALKKGDEKKAEKLKRQWEHERFARGFEVYLKHGEAPTKGLRAVFAKFRAFLQRVYQAFTGTGGRATPEVEAVMARMISIEDSSDLSGYPQGKKTAVYTDSGKQIPVQYRVVSADDLIASHDAGALEINPGYPVALQPRDRERLIMREQVTRMANTLRSEDLADARNLNQGAPLIRNDGVVLNGNGRTIAIARAQARNKERAAAYRDYLVENAALFGFSKDEIENVKNPVLVREVQGDISEGLMQDIISSTTGGARMGASEAAQADAEKITYAMLDAYVPNEKGDLTTAANRNFVAGILHKIVGNGEMNAYLDKDGHVNADGIQRVKRALFACAYGDDELIAKMAESTDDDIRNVSNGMMAAAPMVARLAVKKGVPYVKELQDAISDAVKQLDTLRRSGESVKDYLSAQALFTEHEDSAEMRAILSFLDGNKRSGKRIATFFSRITKELDEMDTPSGNELFDTEIPSLMDVLDGARKHAENGSQEGLFVENADNTSVAEGIEQGARAVKRVLSDHQDVPNAMYREETGGIDFVYGEAGNPAKKYAGGYGIAHILAKHGQEAVDMIPTVIAKGKAIQKYSDRIHFNFGDYTAVVRLDFDGKKKTWLVTNFEKYANKKDSPSAEDFARSADKSDGARSTVGGNLSSISNIPLTEVEGKGAGITYIRNKATYSDRKSDSEGPYSRGEFKDGMFRVWRHDMKKAEGLSFTMEELVMAMRSSANSHYALRKFLEKMDIDDAEQQLKSISDPKKQERMRAFWENDTEWGLNSAAQDHAIDSMVRVVENLYKTVTGKDIHEKESIETFFHLAPALKKAALEYGAKDERGKVTFADETRKQEFLKIAKALLSAAERKTSARRQESLKEMLDGIRLIPPTRVSPRKRVLVDWGREIGVPVVFFKGDPSLHGFHQDGVTFLNVDSEITPQWTFWHEAMHWMKANNPDIYNDLVEAISGAEGFTKEQLDAYRKEIGAPDMSDADVIEEMIADALPDVKRRVPLLRNIGKHDTGLVQRVVAWIRDVMRRFHDHFHTPKGGLTSAQRVAMTRAFGNLVGSIRDANGKRIFHIENEGVRITLRNGKPLPTVKFSLDNTGKVGDNEGGRNLGEARKEAICSNVLARMKTRVHEMLKQGVPFAEIQKELEDENSTSREEALRVFKTQWNIFNSPRVNKRNIVERITKREDFTDDEVNELFEQYKATMKEMLDYGGFIYKEAAFQQRGNREFLAGVHSWRDLERANARHGGSAHTGHKNSLNTKHLESQQGAFSMPKFSARTKEETPKGNFGRLKEGIRSLVGVKAAENLELPGRVQRTVTLSPKDLEKRIRERWIQEKNIIFKEKQKDGKIAVTYYPDTHDVGYADHVKSVRQVAKRNPFVKVLYDLAHKAMKKQEKLRNEFGKALKELNELVKNKEDLKSITVILWQGDAEGKAFTDAELRGMGANDRVIKAYKLVRRELEKAYKMLRDAQTQVKTRSQTLEPESVESFKKSHWIEDEDVISAVPRADGTVLLTWRGGRTYDVKGKTMDAEALELMKKDENVNVTSVIPKGDGTFSVSYVERIKPVFRRTGYMPHFFHEWMIYEKYKDPKTGEERYTSVASGRTMNEAVKIGNEIAAKNKDKQYVLRPKGFDLGTENAVVIGDMDFAQMSRKLAESTEVSLADARSLLLEDAGMSLKSRHRFFGSLLERKDGKGFDQDVQWVLAHYLNGASRYIAMEEFKPAAISMYERFFGRFDDEPKNLTAQYCKNLINDVNGNPRGVEVWLNDLIKKTPIGKYVADSFGDRVALALNGELSTWNAITKLGLGNFASAAVNFSQFINVGAALNDYGYAMNGLKRALNPSALDEKIIEASGLLDDINMADDNGGYTQRRGGKVRGIYSALKKGGEWTLIPFQKADTLMRKAAVLGAYYQGIEQKGMKTAPGDELSAEAIAYAQEINDDANFDYSSANAPNMLRAGSVVTQQLFQFQKYPIMQFEFMYNILKNGTRGQKVRMFVPYVIFCGIGASIPFGSLFNQLFSFLFGLATGDDEDIAQEIKAEVLRWAGKDPVKKAIAETALYGVLAPTFGLDISGRIGMSNAFAGEFYGEKPDSISGIVGQQLGGPMAVSAINMLRQAHEGNPIEALKALSPALGNMAQAAVGESRTTRHRVNTRYDTAYDKIAHALGFRSVGESNNAFIMNYEYEQKSKLTRTKREAIQDYIADPSDENRRTINALGITEKQIKEARIQQERTALERAREGRPKTSNKAGASRRRKEEAKRETLYDTLDDE